MSERQINNTGVKVMDCNEKASVFFNQKKTSNVVKNYMYDFCKIIIPAISFPEEAKL